MRQRRLAIAALGALVWCLSLPHGWSGLGAARSVAAAQEAGAQDPLPKGPGRDTVLSTCGVCHEIDTAIGKRRTAADWQDILNAMINRGAMGSQDEFKAILAYMSKYFGIVNVNTATAKEMADVLELSDAAAGAIVQFRVQNGEFKTLEALKNVPGLDAAAVEKRKDRVAFK